MPPLLLRFTAVLIHPWGREGGGGGTELPGVGTEVHSSSSSPSLFPLRRILHQPYAHPARLTPCTRNRNGVFSVKVSKGRRTVTLVAPMGRTTPGTGCPVVLVQYMLCSRCACSNSHSNQSISDSGSSKMPCHTIYGKAPTMWEVSKLRFREGRCRPGPGVRSAGHTHAALRVAAQFTGHSGLLMSSGCDAGRSYCVALGTGVVPNKM